MPQPSIGTPSFRYSISFTSILDDGSETDLSKWVSNVSIISSVTSVWPVFLISLTVDNEDIIIDNIYGQHIFKLTIQLTTEEKNISPIDSYTVYLYYLQANTNLVSKRYTSDSKSHLDIESFSFVPYFALNNMSTVVNHVHQEEYGQITAMDFLMEILEKYEKQNVNIGMTNISKQLYKQAIVPCLSLNSAIEFIDSIMPLYRGFTFKYFDSNGTLLLWDLSSKINDSPHYTVYQLPASEPDRDKTEDALESTTLRTENPYFLSVAPVESIYHSNANIANQGYSKKSVVHPDNYLYYMSKATIDDVLNDNLFVTPKDHTSLLYNKDLNAVHKFTYGLGRDDNDIRIKKLHTAQSYRMSALRCSFTDSILISKVMNVGRCVEFKTRTLEYIKYNGKYILDICRLTLSRDKNESWKIECSIDLSRASHQENSKVAI